MRDSGNLTFWCEEMRSELWLQESCWASQWDQPQFCPTGGRTGESSWGHSHELLPHPSDAAPGPCLAFWRKCPVLSGSVWIPLETGKKLLLAPSPMCEFN